MPRTYPLGLAPPAQLLASAPLLPVVWKGAGRFPRYGSERDRGECVAGACTRTRMASHGGRTTTAAGLLARSAWPRGDARKHAGACAGAPGGGPGPTVCGRGPPR